MLSANLKEKNITILFRLDACVIFDIHMGFLADNICLNLVITLFFPF
jgi:hypothetical protein